MQSTAHTLNQALESRGLTTRKSRAYRRKDILDAATGEVVLECASAHETWRWLKTGAAPLECPECWGELEHTGASCKACEQAKRGGFEEEPIFTFTCPQ